MKFKLLISLGLALGLSATVLARDKGPHDSAIKARQGLMQLYSFNMGILGAMAKGKIDYDADAAKVAAANLLATTSIDQSAMWPEGSDADNDANKKNRASVEIWKTYPKIVEANKATSDAFMALNEAAGGGLDALKEAMGPAGKSCKGCHDDFRTKKK